MDLSEENIVDIVKKPSNKKSNLKRYFPNIKKCCYCPCISLDLAIKLSTMLLMVSIIYEIPNYYSFSFLTLYKFLKFYI